MRTAQTGLFVVACIVALVIGFLFALITAWELLYKNGMTKCCEQQCMKCAQCLKYKKCLDLTLKLINAIFLIIAVVISSKTKSFFTDLGDSKCSDDDTNVVLANFAEQVREFVYSKNLKALIVFCIMMLVEILRLVYMKTCGKKDNEKERKKEKDKNGHKAQNYQNDSVNNGLNNQNMQNGKFNPTLNF